MVTKALTEIKENGLGLGILGKHYKQKTKPF